MNHKRRKQMIAGIAVAALLCSAVIVSGCAEHKEHKEQNGQETSLLQEEGGRGRGQAVTFEVLNESARHELLADDAVKVSYEQLQNAAPGGYILQETDKDYYLLVSGGKHPTVAAGFTVDQLRWVEEQDGQSPFIHIAAHPLLEEEGAAKIDHDAAFAHGSAKSLLRVSKLDLPPKAEVVGFSLTGLQ
ncbi:hypothetical protein [Paenibacillus sp. GCM10027626]|uniref:hypothetical protein n=1 Tax=Paenibacillus sp. GCM10027626 TaxID=3273411 RepID=UPI0036336E67